mgnify:CR=1 FL=1
MALTDDRKDLVRTLNKLIETYNKAIEQDDDAKAPADKTTFAEAATAADVTAKVEVYAGDHGWMVVDSPAYDATAAARGEADLKALYAAALA